MINTLQISLESALSKLYNHFPNVSETLHEAVAIVFSSIFRKFGIQCIIVVGQSAAYWMRIPSSTDVDFVIKNGNQISERLENCGFIKIDKFQFRYKHPSTNILIELVDDQITIKGVRKIDTVEVQQEEIEDPIVKALMPGPAEIFDPVRVFLNYVEASSNQEPSPKPDQMEQHAPSCIQTETCLARMIGVPRNPHTTYLPLHGPNQRNDSSHYHLGRSHLCRWALS